GDAVVEPRLAAGDARPEALLFLVQVPRVDPLPLPLDHGEAAADLRRDRNEQRRRLQLSPGPQLDTAARRRRYARPLAVKVRSEQRVQRDDAVGVRRTFLDDVDAGP